MERLTAYYRFLLISILIITSGCEKNTFSDAPGIGESSNKEVILADYQEDDLTLHGMSDVLKKGIKDNQESYFSSFEIRNAFDFKNMGDGVDFFKKRANIFKMHFKFKEANKKQLLCSIKTTRKLEGIISLNTVIANEGEDVIFYPSSRKNLQFISLKEKFSEENLYPKDKIDIMGESMFLYCNLDGQQIFDIELRKDLIVYDSSLLKSLSIYENSKKYQMVHDDKKIITWDYDSLLPILNSKESVGNYGALWFIQGAFYTQGNFFNIDAKKIIFEQTILKSFPQVSMESNERINLSAMVRNTNYARDGVSGGVVFIATVQVSGGLSTQLTGQNGENGVNGHIGEDAGDGANGGDCGAVNITYKDKNSSSFFNSFYEGTCIVGKKGLRGIPGGPPDITEFDPAIEDDRIIGHGPSGKEGLDGHDGTDGFTSFNLKLPYRSFKLKDAEKIF